MVAVIPSLVLPQSFQIKRRVVVLLWENTESEKVIQEDLALLISYMALTAPTVMHSTGI